MTTAVKLVGVTARMSVDTKAYYDQTREASGANSSGEFILLLLDKFNAETEPQTIEKVVEIERRHEENELSVKLTHAQYWALRNTVLSTNDFAESQNSVIDNLATGNRPFMYFGNLFDQEFQSLWIRSRPFSDKTTPGEALESIKFNMSAFLVNMFFTNLIENRISETLVTDETLKRYLKEQKKLMKPKDQDNPV